MDAMGDGECQHPREFWYSSDDHPLFCGICGEDFILDESGHAVLSRDAE